jgi:ribosomal protein S18 acetylase RimI-like enzyme
MVDIAAGVQEAGTVRKAARDESPRVAAALARAFDSDPQMQWVLTDDSRRVPIAERGFDLYLRKLWFAQDECYTTDGVAGAAIWNRPGEWHVSILRQLRLLPAMTRIYRRFLPRVVRAITALESNHPKERHYYLPFVGVDPDWQGRGIGSALLRPVLDRCDREATPAYLEASTPRNRALYERHGFEVIEEFELGPGAPLMWRMWRLPRSVSGAG